MLIGDEAVQALGRAKVLVFGVGGQMITPTHVCLIVSLDYFKADFFKTLVPVIVAEALLLGVFSAYSYLTWAG